MITDKQRIEHILTAIEKIEQFAGQSEEFFSSSESIRDAVSYNFLIIGEAANKLSTELRALYSNIPWRILIATRNILIHDYVQTDYHLLWLTIQNDLPVLKLQLQDMVQKLN